MPVDRPQTLADYLADALPEASPRSRQRLIRFGRVRVNGQTASAPDQTLSPGDDVAILPPAAPEAESDPGDRTQPDRPTTPPRPRTPRPGTMQPRPHAPASPSPRAPSGERRRERPDRRSEPGPRRSGALRVLHEDADLIVVDKPPGLLTASPTPVTEPTLLDLLKDHLRESTPRGAGRRRAARMRLGVIHRLDKEASGVLVFSKSDRGFDWLKEDFRAKRVHRMYVALVEGIVGEPGTLGTVQSFLREMPGGKVVSIPTDQYRGAPGGPSRGDDERPGRPGEAKLAVTHYRVTAAANGMSLLQVRLETGRKNQIRVHLAERGHPIVGDRRYGAKTDPLRRLALHAAELGFTHPETGQSLRFTSPASDGFYRAVGLTPPPQPAAPEVASPAPQPREQRRERAAAETSWDDVAEWYDEMLEGDQPRSDHYEKVILPGTVRLLEPRSGERLLDVACGQGILARRVSSLGVEVTGVEASPGLVDAARRRSADASPGITYHVGDARELDKLELPHDFDAAACIMALSNIDPLEPVLRGVAARLRPGGRFVAVLSHPAFRAPGQTAWDWDARNKRQYRRVEGYLSPGQHRIQMHPGKDPSVATWTFHRPLQTYIRALADAGLLVDALEEWPGQRQSTSGPRAAEENRARREIPLFLAIRAVRIPRPETPAR